MSTVFSIRVWWDDAPLAYEGVARLMEAVEAAGLRDGPWWPVQASDPFLRSAGQDAVVGDAAQARALGQGAGAGVAVRVITGCPWGVWRFDGPNASRGRVAVTLAAWDPAHRAAMGADRRIEGDASITADVGPFVALLDPSPAAAALNERIEENLERVMDCVKALVTTGAPLRIGVTSDAGDPLPVNQHLAWFRSAVEAANEATFVAELAANGLPAHKVRPLGGPDAASDGALLHGWRSAEARQALADQLRGVVGRVAHPDDVRAALASRRFDVLEDPGLAVFDYPHLFNAFLDRFYLAVLGAST